MKIVIDTTPLHSAHKTRGIGRYTRKLVESLQSVSGDYLIIQTSKVESVDAPDLVHYPYFDLFQSHLPLFPQARKEIVTIHDLIPIRFKEAFRPGFRSGLNLWLQMKLVKRMSAILTDSTVSKNDIIEFLGIDRAKVFVIPLGVDEEFHPLSRSEVENVRRRYHLPRRYVLYVGDVNVNKNIPALLRALKKIPISLVMVSSSISNRSLPEVRLIEKIVEEDRLGKKVIMLDRIPSDPTRDLVALYCGATVYVQPSFYEGFGLPVLEAMACGTPVVSSNAASLPEVAGNAAVFVDPTPQSIQKGIRKILESSKLRLDLQKKGFERAKEMTWKKTARRTMSIYEDILL